MSIGTYISGTGHAALVIWLIAGWGMQSDPLDFEVTEVSVVSGDEFEAMMRAGQPDAPVEDVATPEAPVADVTPPTPVEETPPEIAQTPPAVEPPAPETPPVAPEIETPQAEVTDVLPDLPDVADVTAPPPSTELGTSLRPKPRPAPRIAQTLVTPPEPDAVVSEEVAAATTEAPSDQTTQEQVDNTTSPEEATTEVVTEAETPAGAPEVSVRPQGRPNRPAPQVAETAEAASTDDSDAIAAALEAATASQAPTQGVSGGDLSDAAKTGFLRQVGSCWNVGSASTGALQTNVTVAFSMTQDGLVDTNSIRMIGSSGGSDNDAAVAFRIAKSALVRCQNANGRSGYDLPSEQYDAWRNVEITFNPERMRTR